jgi:hypothetical protein
MGISIQPLRSEQPFVSQASDLHYVRDYSTITVDTIKQALRIDSDDNSNDVVLGFILAGVKDMADMYLQRPSFIEPESGLSQPLPAPVELWVLQTSTRHFEQRQNGVTKVDIKDAQVTEWGSVDYSLLFPYRTFFGF